MENIKMCSEEKEIILEIENTPVTCSKEDLISNSDYFRAMLEGNFIEKNQSRIKLEDVDLKSMNIILTLLWDESYLIPNEDILLVLHTACMLQFMKIRNMCLERIIEMLSPKNCIKIWRMTEQLDIKPLFLKAKAMALDEFLQIKDTDCILEFTLEEICNYLGHINLKTDNEMNVFQTAMRWWYENNDHYFENTTQVLIKLLCCVDFQNLTENYLKEIMVYPDIADNRELIEILSCILLFKNDKSIDHLPVISQRNANLLYRCRGRASSRFPCISVSYVHPEGKNKKIKVSQEQQQHQKIIYYDKFKRKRLYEVVENDMKTDITVVFYDYNAKQFKKFFDIDGKKCTSLDGFKLVGYKEFIFMYGGEFLIGKGNWNYNFWVYDTIRERWERKGVLPFPRRHFETCMVGDILYIVGGTGVFRVIQENMFWYSYKDNKWSAQMALPCSGRQLKCCSFLDQLFILNVNNKCGYFFDDKRFHWLKMDLRMDDTLVSNEGEYAVFSYKNKLYIKGKNLVEFKVTDKEIVVVSVKEVSNIICDKMELVLCDNIAYTLYKYRCDDNDVYCLETYNLSTGDKEYIFKDVSSDDTVIDINGDKYTVSSTLKLLSFQHYSLVEKNNLINDCFA